MPPTTEEHRRDRSLAYRHRRRGRRRRLGLGLLDDPQQLHIPAGTLLPGTGSVCGPVRSGVRSGRADCPGRPYRPGAGNVVLCPGPVLRLD